MRLTLVILGAALLFGACAARPVYAPAAQPGAAGYSEQRIETNRWRVTYRSEGGADPALAADFALLRAADLTILSGNDWFVVDRRDVESQRGSSGPRVNVGVGGGRDGPSVTSLEIRMGRGPAPEGPNTYNARDVAQSLRARLNAPAGA